MEFNVSRKRSIPLKVWALVPPQETQLDIFVQRPISSHFYFISILWVFCLFVAHSCHLVLKVSVHCLSPFFVSQASLILFLSSLRVVQIPIETSFLLELAIFVQVSLFIYDLRFATHLVQTIINHTFDSLSPSSWRVFFKRGDPHCSISESLGRLLTPPNWHLCAETLYSDTHFLEFISNFDHSSNVFKRSFRCFL